jgi:hypothetical protein
VVSATTWVDGEWREGPSRGEEGAEEMEVTGTGRCKGTVGMATDRPTRSNDESSL